MYVKYQKALETDVRQFYFTERCWLGLIRCTHSVHGTSDVFFVFCAHQEETKQKRLAVLCCAVLCCAVLCCAVLCCAVLCCAVLCCAVLCCAVLCCATGSD